MKRPLIGFVVGVILVAAVGAGYKIKTENSIFGANTCKDCNVILITLTNLRYDHMSGNGYSRPTTPSLDALAKESLVFDSAFSHSSWTLPEGVSIFTSLYPYQHGVMNRFNGSVLSKDTPSLIDILSLKGYKTAGFTGGFDYDPRFGLTSRFGEYKGCEEGEGVSITTLGYGKVDCATSKALEWIKNNLKSKFFVQIQGYDVHCPFSQKGGKTYDKNYIGNTDFSNCFWTFDKTNPVTKNGKKYYPVYSSKTGKQVLLDDADVRHLVSLYDESIKDSDTILGNFLDQLKSLGLDKKTIIIFTSEHGDMFGKYGRFMRGGPLRGTFYDDVLHVPLIMKIPGINPDRYSKLVEQIDIMPTILDFLSIKKPTVLQGKSLFPLIFAGKDIHQDVFAGSEYEPGFDNIYFNDITREESVRNSDWKLIREVDVSKNSGIISSELYNLKLDPQELNNVANTNQDVLKNLESILDSWSVRMRKK